MRAFIALEVSDAIKETLARAESHLKYSGADVKWVNPDAIHLTLKFLGDITDNKAEEVRSALDSISLKAKSFELTVEGIGAFPGTGHPRVIWAGLEKGAVETVSLAGRIDEEMAMLGFTRESRPFSPHLTIGRVRSARNIGKLMEKFASVASSIAFSAAPQHKVSSLILFQSTLTPHGSIYTKIHDARFSE